MNNKEILEKAIQKAIDGGWKGKMGILPEHWAVEYYRRATIENLLEFNGYQLIIYTHDFAKALWGEGDIEVFQGFGHDPGMSDDDPGDDYNIYDYEVAWEYHMKEMVISEDPIKYLGENLPD